MKLSPRQKKWRKRILIFLALRVILGAVFFYVVDYRFKEIIQLAVKEKSNDIYAFDAKGIDVSIFKKNIIIKNAILYRKDTVNTGSHYNVKIPELYFSISSFKDLIFHKKVSVDSISIISPHIDFHQHIKEPSTQTSFNPHGVEIFLHKILKHLQVKTFHINNGSYVFRSRLTPSTLKISRINFTVKNFSNTENEHKHLFAAEDIDLLIGKQQISLPDGIHSLYFKDLHFSGKKQYVELDSFEFHAKATPNRAPTKISAGKIRFKSSELSEIFSKDELVLDTVIVQNPVLEFGKSKNKTTKTPKNIKLEEIFKKLKFKYISIQNGSFLNSDSLISRSQYATKKVNVKIYNLSYFPAKPKLFKIDSMKLDLNKIKFISKDGKSQLTVDELAILNNEVIFKNAVYTSVHPLRENNLTFITPELHLKNVNIGDLLDKKIAAEQADLLYPVIKIYSKAKKTSATDTIADFSGTFAVLNNISNLIAVKKFNIIDGSLSLKSQSKVLTSVDIEKLNVNILGNKLLSSDTTLELKHAIPELRFKLMELKSPKVHLLLHNYHFIGTYRHNWAESLLVNLPNGTRLKANNLYWEWFDWDLYRSYKMAFVDSLKINHLDVFINKQKAQKHQQIPLPKLHLARFDIVNINFNQVNGKGNIQFTGNNIFGKKLETKNTILIWNNLGGVLNNIVYTDNQLSATASKAKINAIENNEIENIAIMVNQPDKNIAISLPIMQLKGPFTSSNFKEINLKSFVMSNPDIKLVISDSNKVSVKKPFSIPLAFNIEHFQINKAKLNIKHIKGNDTLAIASNLNLRLKNLRGNKNGTELISIKSSELDLADFNFSMPHLVFSTPLLFKSNNTFITKENDGIKLSSEIDFYSKSLNLDYIKDSIALKLSKATFNIVDKNFKYEQKKPFSWGKILYKTNIENADVNYLGKTSSVELNNLQWFSQEKKLKLLNLKFKPNLSLEETKLKQPFQADYMWGSAGVVLINGLAISEFNLKKRIEIDDVFIDSAKFSVSRDKRMPLKNLNEKLMPTKLLAEIKTPVKLKHLYVNNGKVDVHEISMITGREGIIPLTDIKAEILNLNNSFGAKDSLVLKGVAKLMGKNNVALNYRESYLDSLSDFKMDLLIAPIDMAFLSPISAPLASIKITKGNAQTITASWQGNKYFADGRIFLPYQNLHVNLLDKKNPERKSFVLFFENALVNMLVRNDNRKQSFMFFERTQNKFVFNYWIKTLLSGFASSTGLKSDNKLKKMDTKTRKLHQLTVIN